MLPSVINCSDVTHLPVPQKKNKAFAQETKSIPTLPSLRYHPRSTHLTFLVTAKYTKAGNSHSHPGNGDTRGQGSPQVGSGACPG